MVTVPDVFGRILLAPIVWVECRVAPVGPVRFVGDGSGGSAFRLIDALNVPLWFCGWRLVMVSGERWSIEWCTA